MSEAIDPLTHELREKLASADFLRKNQQWATALENYLAVLLSAPKFATVHHNAGLCLFALGRYKEALTYCENALRFDSTLWQASLVRIKVLRKMGLRTAVREAFENTLFHGQPALEVEKASFFLNELCDASTAREIVTRVGNANQSFETSMIGCLAALYDPGLQTATQVSASLRLYAEEYLYGHSLPSRAIQRTTTNGRKRVGIISPQLRATPVYFFGIGVLRLLALDVDLVFFHRSDKEDWATPQFKNIASGWIDVSQLLPVELERTIRAQNLNVLIDMGGWMDTQALVALAKKPAERMFKWIGGQSASTGLRAFDGFISDAEQSPPELQSLYSEPLILMASGYVTYSAPSYFPALQAADPGLVLGVVANPTKISNAFLIYLKNQFIFWSTQGIFPTLRFIENKFKHPDLQKRIRVALGEHVKAEFVAPEGHVAYLNAVGRLHTVIDTFPYTGGLTTVEALMLGVPVRTRKGTLFCERHTSAHCHYAGIAQEHYLLEGWRPSEVDGNPRKPLLLAGSPRLDHEALARELLTLF